MTSHSAGRMHNAFNFLRDELPHCQDMIKYLNDGSQPSSNKYKFGDDEISIDVTNYKIKLGQKTSHNPHGAKEKCIYQHIDSEPIRSTNFSHKRNSRSQINITQRVTKPTFQKVSQVDCSNMSENAEESSLYSSFHNSFEISQNSIQDNDKLCAQTATDKDVFVKSPDYCRKSAAEVRARNARLTNYTKKAYSVMKELRKQKHQKAQSCSPLRNSLAVGRFKSLRIEPDNKPIPEIRLGEPVYPITPSEILNSRNTLISSNNYGTEPRKTD